ncbi:DUF3299 domain-containing protein [Ferrimonas pelagia]|uniref:DUF3299 domain-containing protein n=1 Tax=Ferrimonas pelagia TaxID=1177826 RepID=A0ABP9F658_9GAMM
MKYCTTLLLLLSLTTPAWATERTLGWGDLMPQLSEIRAQLGIAETDPPQPLDWQQVQTLLVQELDGQQIRLPGFIVPLSHDDTRVTEFLLVPTYGACIHMPPPPPNQLLHVHYPDGIEVQDLQQAVWIYGQIHTEGEDKSGFDAGYRLDARAVELYQP